jgi:hypothetical protein
VGKPDLRDAVSAVIQDKQFQLMTPLRDCYVTILPERTPKIIL